MITKTPLLISSCRFDSPQPDGEEVHPNELDDEMDPDEMEDMGEMDEDDEGDSPSGLGPV